MLLSENLFRASMRLRTPKRKVLLLIIVFLALIALSLIIGFLTYPEELRPSIFAPQTTPATLQPKRGVPETPIPTPMPTPPSPMPSPRPQPAEKAPEAVQPPEIKAEAEFSKLELIGRMIIYTARVSMEVEDVEAAVNEIQSIAEGLGGFVQRIAVSSGARKSGVITIRVPQERFYHALDLVRRIGNVTDMEVSGQDVTEQYIDLEARLRNAEMEEERLLAILEKATDVEDMLKIEKELMRVREMIESIKGQLQYLERRVQYSTISVYLEERAKPPVISNVRVVEVTTSKAVIEWTTDVPSTSLVEYGPTKSYGYEVYDSKLVKEHSLTISGLKDSTTYHFRVKSTAYDKTATSGDYTFTTKAEPWVKIPDIDWGHPIERGIWGFLVLAQFLVTILVFLAPFALIFGPPIYYFYKRRQGFRESSEQKET